MRRLQRQKRIVILLFCFLGTGFLLLGRLIFIQVVKGSDYARAAVNQRSLRFVYATGRGQIFDRQGISLLDTRLEPVLVSFEPVLDQGTREVLANSGLARRDTVQAIREADPALYRLLAEKGPAGLIPLREEVRYGPGALAPHVTGYVQRQETVRRRPAYRELSYIARGGLEHYFNEELAAARPATLAALVDGQGRLIGGLGIRDWHNERPGRPYNIVTTIDSRIQKAVESTGGAYLESGAVVILDPASGDILAMASFPGFSQGALFGGISHEEYRQLAENPYNPFINKAIASYPPGSVFKTILAAAALDKGLMDDQPFVCYGFILVGDREFSCFHGQPHGEVDLTRALAVSCNAYFVSLGQRLGRELVLEYARRFGLGRATYITLGGESKGNIPSAGDLPYLGDLANASIGQGLVETTPLQVARLMATVVNGGRDIAPRLVLEVTDSNGGTVRRFPVRYGTRVITPASAQRLVKMLEQVVLSGTATDAKSLNFTTAGKSGTAQSGRTGVESYSWFAGFATPGDRPLVIVVFAEKRRDKTAAWIFRELAEKVSEIY